MVSSMIDRNTDDDLNEAGAPKPDLKVQGAVTEAMRARRGEEAHRQLSAIDDAIGGIFEEWALRGVIVKSDKPVGAGRPGETEGGQYTEWCFRRVEAALDVYCIGRKADRIEMDTLLRRVFADGMDMNCPWGRLLMKHVRQIGRRLRDGIQATPYKRLVEVED